MPESAQKSPLTETERQGLLAISRRMCWIGLVFWVGVIPAVFGAMLLLGPGWALGLVFLLIVPIRLWQDRWLCPRCGKQFMEVRKAPWLPVTACVQGCGLSLRDLKT